MPYSRFLFLNLGHALDHLFMLLFTALAALAAVEMGAEYSELLYLATGGFIAFGACSLPMGWLADKFSRDTMMSVFFVGIGAAVVLTGLAQSPMQIAVTLTLTGVFAAIYHPVGLAMVAQGGGDVGRRLGVNGVWGNMGVAASALAIGLFAEYVGWRAAFISLGVFSIVAGLAWTRVAAATRVDGGGAKKKSTGSPSADWKRVLLVIAVTTAIGGYIFNTMTVSLPKVLDDRLAGLGLSALDVGAIASAVYAAAAFTQIVVGRAIDRYAIKPIFLAIVAGQAVTLYLAAHATGWAMVGLSVMVMALVFGQIPINDTLIAHHTPDHWRGRVYSVKYVLSFTISAGAVPILAMLYAGADGSATVFTVGALLAVVITAATAFLPGGRAEQAPAGAGDD